MTQEENIRLINIEIEKLKTRQPAAFLNFGVGPSVNHYLVELMKLGWHGIFVECKPSNFVSFHNGLRNSSFSFDCILGAVGAYSEKYDCRILSSPIDNRDTSPTLCNPRKPDAYDIYVPTVCLETLLAHAPMPVAFMSIDCEGAEHEIFHNFSFKVKPHAIKLAFHDGSFYKYSAYGQEREITNSECLCKTFRENGYCVKVRESETRGEHLWFALE